MQLFHIVRKDVKMLCNDMVDFVSCLTRKYVLVLVLVLLSCIICLEGRNVTDERCKIAKAIILLTMLNLKDKVFLGSSTFIV